MIKNGNPSFDSTILFKVLKALNNKTFHSLSHQHYTKLVTCNFLSCRQLTKRLSKTKLLLKGRALLNDLTTSTHVCQILKLMRSTRNTRRGANQIGPPWHLWVQEMSYVPSSDQLGSSSLTLKEYKPFPSTWTTSIGW